MARFNPIKYYSGGGSAVRKPLIVKAPRRKYTQARMPQQLSTAGHLWDKAAPMIADLINANREEEIRSADQANVEKMIEALTAPRTAYDPDKYGTSSEDLMVAAEGYTPEDGVVGDEQILSPEAQREFYTEEADRVRKAYGTGDPAGADLVRQQAAAGEYNMPTQSNWLAEQFGADPSKGRMGPRSSDLMMKILLGDKEKKDAAELLAADRAYDERVAKTLAEGKLAVARAKRGNVKYGNTPIWGTDKDGRSIVMQPSSAGGPLRVADLPEGVTAQRGGTRTVDLGDRYAVLDANGGLIGYRAKGIDPEKTPEHTGSVAAAKAGGAGIANRRLKEYILARNATNNIKDIDMLTSRLLSTDENVVGFLVDLRVFRDQALAKFGSQEALARVTDTQMVNTLTGKEVFPLIKALGIGARGLDTPAERKFLREVLTGDKTLTKDTLLEMAAMRRRVQVRNIERWNKDFKEGSLNDFLRTNNIPNRAFAMPPPAPVRTPINISMPISQMNVMQLNEKAKSATADERRKIGLQLDALGYK